MKLEVAAVAVPLLLKAGTRELGVMLSDAAGRDDVPPPEEGFY